MRSVAAAAVEGAEGGREGQQEGAACAGGGGGGRRLRCRAAGERERPRPTRRAGAGTGALPRPCLARPAPAARRRPAASLFRARPPPPPAPRRTRVLLERRDGAVHDIQQAAAGLRGVRHRQPPHVEAVLALDGAAAAAQQLDAAVGGVQLHHVLGLIQDARTVGAASRQRVDVDICGEVGGEGGRGVRAEGRGSAIWGVPGNGCSRAPRARGGGACCCACPPAPGAPPRARTRACGPPRPRRAAPVVNAWRPENLQ
jgi:hypothetical protein